MPEQVVIGVDAGGSKTCVLIGQVAQGKLSTLGRAVGPPGNPRSIGFQAALNSLQNTIGQALLTAGLQPMTRVACACLSIAGAGRTDEQQRIVSWFQSKNLASEILVAGDAECLLAAAGLAADNAGIALIAGTGSIAWGRSAAGRTSRAGGFGFLIDDEGSGYWIASEALRQVCKAADARNVPTNLLGSVLDHLGLSSPHELIEWCYGSDNQRARIAALAPLVFEQFSYDTAAQKIVRGGAQRLAELVAAVAADLALTTAGFTLACTGSVLLRQPVYRDLLAAELSRLGAAPASICMVEEPAWGALKIASQRAAPDQLISGV